jgi:dipeptidase E
MKRRTFIQATTLTMGLPLISMAENININPVDSELKRRLLVFGSGNFRAFLKYIIPFTKKDNPKICFLPTATGDSTTSITGWYEVCEELPVKPYVMKTFISSYDTKKSFEERLMSMDAVFVGGGNTLNMLAVWKAQGIDVSLRKAYDAGVLMTGGSAGSLCWFQSGTTDSRPIKLSTVECMGWIKGSHCPHFDAEEFRRPLYHDLIKKGELEPGYACDNQAGIYFENEQFIKSVALNDKSKSYYVSLVDGKISEKELPTEILK